MLISLTGGTEKKNSNLLPLVRHDIHLDTNPGPGVFQHQRKNDRVGIGAQIGAWDGCRQYCAWIYCIDINALPSGDVVHLGFTEGAALC